MNSRVCFYSIRGSGGGGGPPAFIPLVCPSDRSPPTTPVLLSNPQRGLIQIRYVPQRCFLSVWVFVLEVFLFRFSVMQLFFCFSFPPLCLCLDWKQTEMTGFHWAWPHEDHANPQNNFQCKETKQSQTLTLCSRYMNLFWCISFRVSVLICW